MGKDAPGAIVATISRDIVGIYAEYYGRGPTRAKTTWHDNLVVCILEEVLGRAERLLVERGHFEQVRLNRQAFGDQVGPLFSAAVERATDRRVAAYLTQVDPTGIAAEVFVLSERVG